MANSYLLYSMICTVMVHSSLFHFALKDIGMFLLESCSKDDQLWVVAEALDAIFDVFAEDHLDPVVKEISLVEKLKTLAPSLKQKASS